MDVVQQAEMIVYRQLGELWARDGRPPAQQTYPFAVPWWLNGALFHLTYAAAHLAYVTVSLGAALHHLALAGRAVTGSGSETRERAA